MIGVVSQQNTLDRQLTPWENLYFHGRLFGMGTRESKQIADELLERSSSLGSPRPPCTPSRAAWLSA